MRPDTLRPCMIDEQEIAFFHEWTHRSQVIEPSPLVGGHPGGMASRTFAIVEFLDGSVDIVDPQLIRFTDI